MTIHTWESGAAYEAGDTVEHNGKVYIKDDDGDQSAPDSVPGGWTETSVDAAQLASYQAIESSFNNYEQRVKDHRAQVMAALAAEGLNPDDVKAVLNAKS